MSQNCGNTVLTHNHCCKFDQSEPGRSGRSCTKKPPQLPYRCYHWGGWCRNSQGVSRNKLIRDTEEDVGMGVGGIKFGQFGVKFFPKILKDRADPRMHDRPNLLLAMKAEPPPPR